MPGKDSNSFNLIYFQTFLCLVFMARNVRQSQYYSLILRRFLNRLWSIWYHDFIIICITKKLEVRISAYTSFISDFHKFYCVEKLVLHYLIFLVIMISKC